MRTKISWNPVVGYTGRRGPCHKYSLAGAKSSPVDTRSRFSLLPLSIWYSISLRDRYLVGPVLEHGACGRRVFMWLAQVSQGAWVPHSVYWFTCATHWYMRSHHQDRTDEYFTAKYLSATLGSLVPWPLCPTTYILGSVSKTIPIQVTKLSQCLKWLPLFFLLVGGPVPADSEVPPWLAKLPRHMAKVLREAEWLWLGGQWNQWSNAAFMGSAAQYL